MGGGGVRLHERLIGGEAHATGFELAPRREALIEQAKRGLSLVHTLERAGHRVLALRHPHAASHAHGRDDEDDQHESHDQAGYDLAVLLRRAGAFGNPDSSNRRRRPRRPRDRGLGWACRSTRVRRSANGSLRRGIFVRRERGRATWRSRRHGIMLCYGRARGHSDIGTGVTGRDFSQTFWDKALGLPVVCFHVCSFANSMIRRSLRRVM